MLSNSVNRVEVETSPIIEKIAQRNGEDHQGEDHQETEYIKILPESVHRQSCWCDCCSTEIISPDANDAQKELEKQTQQVDLGWTSDTVNVLIDVWSQTLDMKAHSQKLRDVS